MGETWGGVCQQLAVSSRSDLTAALMSVTAVLGSSDIEVRRGVHWSCCAVWTSRMNNPNLIWWVNHIACAVFINIVGGSCAAASTVGVVCECAKITDRRNISCHSSNECVCLNRKTFSS